MENNLYEKLLNGNITKDEILDIPLIYFQDKKILEKAFNYFFWYSHGNNEYIKRFNNIYSDILNIYPTIRMFDNILTYEADFFWKEYKTLYTYQYTNLFSKIIVELNNCKTVKNITKNLYILYDMQNVLKDKYNELLIYMEKYYNLYHLNENDDELDLIKEKIFNLCTFYIGKSKELYEKKFIDNYKEKIKKFFILNLDNEEIKKRVELESKKIKFKYLYQEKNKDIVDDINEVINKYKDEIDINEIKIMIDNFIINSYSKLKDIFKEKDEIIKEYERFKEAKKLINRLNNNYIKYQDNELNNYRDIIKYDENIKKYIYIGKDYSNELDYLKAKKYYFIFEKIKRDLVEKINNIDVSIDNSILDEIKSIIPFNDKYYKFDKNILKCISLNDLASVGIEKNMLNKDNLLNDEAYSIIHKLMVEDGLIWLLLIMKKQNKNSDLEELSINDFYEIISTMDKNIMIAKDLNIDYHYLKNLLFLTKINTNVDKRTLFILGKDVVSKLYDYKLYTDKTSKNILLIAERLYLEMIKRENSTVPYINGACGNYLYSMYDYLDTDILLSGYYTNACFTANGNDNDFLHYCAIDKNGFVIKITDKYNNFVARASGFRNGNCVFINQLRTIYDTPRNECNIESSSELKELIKTFKMACDNIINSSIDNEKIEYVFVTKSYALKKISSNVSKDVTNKIGDRPMNINCLDWENFILNCPDLDDCNEDFGFETDYGKYQVICISQKENKKIDVNDLKFYDPIYTYKRKRGKIKVIDNINEEEIIFINRINAINSYLLNNEIVPVKINSDEILIKGDNWYILTDKNFNVISHCALIFDFEAKKEMEITKMYLHNKEKKLLKKV